MVKLFLIQAVSDKIKSLEMSRSNEMAGRTARAVRGSSRLEAIRKVMFIDVSKAHLYAFINSDIDAFVDLPPECAKPGVCGRLNYWLYGMRPASTGWEIEYSKRLAALGFVAGKASPCCFHRSSDDVSVVVHSDDFVFEGPSGGFDKLIKDLRQHWVIKVRAVLGPELRDDKEVSILNRVVRWVTGGVEYEADPRHVEKLLRDMDMEACKPLSTPGTKPLSEEEESSPLLVGDAVTRYRSGAAKCNYLSVDRPDIPFETKGLCR